jgi:predicted transcriptional regulator
VNETTLRLPAALRKRIAPLARRSGKTPQAWVVDALTREAELSRLREEFIDQAEAAAADIDAGGPVYAMEDVHAYLRANRATQRARRPSPLKAKRSR